MKRCIVLFWKRLWYWVWQREKMVKGKGIKAQIAASYEWRDLELLKRRNDQKIQDDAAMKILADEWKRWLWPKVDYGYMRVAGQDRLEPGNNVIEYRWQFVTTIRICRGGVWYLTQVVKNLNRFYPRDVTDSVIMKDMFSAADLLIKAVYFGQMLMEVGDVLDKPWDNELLNNGRSPLFIRDPDQRSEVERLREDLR